MDKFNCHNCGKELFGEIPFCPHCGDKQPSPLSDSDISKNPYKILQVSEDAEPEVIEAAYKSLSKKYHPDIDSSHNTEEKMKDINWAFDMLSDTLKRKQWDRGVKAKHKPEPKPVTPTPKQDFQGESQKRETKTTWRTPEDVVIKKPSRGEGIAPGIILVGIIIVISVFVWFANNPEPYPGTANIASTKQISTKVPTKRPTHTPVRYTTKIPSPTCIHHDRVNQSHLRRNICVYGTVVSAKVQGDEFVIRFLITSKENFLLKSRYYVWRGIRKGDCIEVYGYVTTNNVYYYMHPGKDSIFKSVRCK